MRRAPPWHRGCSRRIRVHRLRSARDRIRRSAHRSAGRRPLHRPPAARAGRHGCHLRAQPPVAQPPLRAQDAVSRAGGQPPGARPLLARGRDRRPAEPPEHRQHPRLGSAARRRPVPGHGAPRRRGPVRADPSARPARGRRAVPDRRPGAGRSHRRAPGRDRAPRPQAVEHLPGPRRRRRRARRAARLRHLEGGRARDHDRRAGDDGDAALHGARAGAGGGRPGRPGHRRLGDGRHPVRDGERRPRLRRRQPAGDRPPDLSRAGGAAVPPLPRRPRRRSSAW